MAKRLVVDPFVNILSREEDHYIGEKVRSGVYTIVGRNKKPRPDGLVQWWLAKEEDDGVEEPKA